MCGYSSIAIEEDETQRLARACNIVIPVICLQISDPKGKMRHNSKSAEEHLVKIEAGDID